MPIIKLTYKDGRRREQQYSFPYPDVINNYKGVMLCSRPNEKKAIDYDKYPLYNQTLLRQSGPRRANRPQPRQKIAGQR
jgi:hypothetical protein